MTALTTETAMHDADKEIEALESVLIAVDVASDHQATHRDFSCAAIAAGYRRAQHSQADPWEMLAEANQLLRSAHSIAARNGADTNWPAFLARLESALDAHAIARATRATRATPA